MKKQNRSMTTGGERGVAARAALVVVLTLTLLGVMRWAMNVTNANARQISHNLSQMKQRLDENEPRNAQERRGRIGPILELERGTKN